MFELFAGADELAVSVVYLRQHSVPASVQVIQIRFEFLCRLLSGRFTQQVLSRMVDVLKTPCSVL